MEFDLNRLGVAVLPNIGPVSAHARTEPTARPKHNAPPVKRETLFAAVVNQLVLAMMLIRFVVRTWSVVVRGTAWRFLL